MSTTISHQEHQRIKDLKELDIQVCDFCRRVNLLNLGREAWGKYACEFHGKEHVLCPKLCLLAARNIVGCELVRKRTKPTEEPVKPNKTYDLANCYLCSKELVGASKKSVIKNRNDPRFWGVRNSSYKILCLGCLGKKFYSKMTDRQRKKFREYRRRGYE